MRFASLITARQARSLATAMALACAAPGHADTAAGTVIVNVADLSFERVGATATTRSNAVSMIVAERLDLTLVFATPDPAAGPGAVPIRLTNLGNGPEAFAVSATIGTDPTPVRIARDGDGDGRYDPAHDPELVVGTTPSLGADTALVLFMIPGDAVGTLRITARATTGSGAPGSVFPGAGEGGGDAVVGPTGAAAELTVPLAAAAGPTLVKSAEVIAPDGTARAVRGAVITYTLVAGFPVAVTAARLDDAVPAGTAYRPGTLMLDDAALSDAVDADPGSADPARVRIALGDVAAGARRTIRFQVTIQ